MEILMVIGSHLLPLIAGILAILIIAGLKKLMDKWGIERSDKIDTMLDTYVNKGIDVAEVAARKYFAENGAKMGGSDKKSKAINVVMEELKQSGITGVAEQLITDRIEGWLEVNGHNPGVPSDPELNGESA